MTDITQSIGNTPLVKLDRFMHGSGTSAAVYGKLESFNPAGSAKDRIALYMINDAERRGVLRPGGTIIEPTSGNTGIGLAMVARARGYRAILTMPESMSVERRRLLSAYGAELVLTDAKLGMQGAVDEAHRLAAQHEGSFIPGQFENPANAQAHYETTGPEIWRDSDGLIDCFVCGVGTGGSITGAGRYLREQNPDIKIIAVEPARSPLLSQGKAGPHGIQGIGANFVPALLDRTVYNEIITVEDDDAKQTMRALTNTQGILAGISSGAALWAAKQAALNGHGQHIVALLPDSGERYLS